MVQELHDLMPDNEGDINMLGMIVADKNLGNRKLMANMLIEDGYNVMITDSATEVIHDILKNSAEILILGRELNELTSAELVPLLKHVNPNLMIILVADDAPLPMIKKIRQEGIFIMH